MHGEVFYNAAAWVDELCHIRLFIALRVCSLSSLQPPDKSCVYLGRDEGFESPVEGRARGVLDK